MTRRRNWAQGLKQNQLWKQFCLKLQREIHAPVLRKSPKNCDYSVSPKSAQRASHHKHASFRIRLTCRREIFIIQFLFDPVPFPKLPLLSTTTYLQSAPTQETSRHVSARMQKWIVPNLKPNGAIGTILLHCRRKWEDGVRANPTHTPMSVLSNMLNWRTEDLWMTCQSFQVRSIGAEHELLARTQLEALGIQPSSRHHPP